MSTKAETALARRRAGLLMKHSEGLNPAERAFLFNMVHLSSHSLVTDGQQDWLQRISCKLMREEVRKQEQNGEYLGKLLSIIGGETCAECQGQLPKERIGVSNFCCSDCVGLYKEATK